MKIFKQLVAATMIVSLMTASAFAMPIKQQNPKNKTFTVRTTTINHIQVPQKVANYITSNHLQEKYGALIGSRVTYGSTANATGKRAVLLFKRGNKITRVSVAQATIQ